MKKIKKTVAVLLVILLTLGRLLPTVVLAEEAGEGGQEETQQTEQTSEPTAESETSPDPSSGTEIDNEVEVTNDVDSTAITGENTIKEPTPTPEPGQTKATSTEEEPEDTSCETEIEGDCSEALPDLGLSDEPEAMPAESPEPSPEATPSAVDTGDAVSVAEVENSVNTTEVGSQVLYQTLNIFVSGDIDLSINPLAIAEEVFVEAENNEPVVNVSVTDIDNIAYLSNDIVSFANTGENSIEGAQEAVINTGNAYSIVSLLNKVNTTITDSTIHIVTINIFGDVQGNILLPELSSEFGGACCGESVQIENSAVVENNIDSSAISGQNTITTTDTEIASINTGSANSAVNLTNIVNTNLIGVIFHYLFINVLGGWLGDFLGWDDFGAANGGGSLSLNSTSTADSIDGDCPTCAGDVSIGNEAQVINNVSSTANTGGNSIEGNGGDINTGEAYSAVSIINFVNSSIIRSVGFFGFINIFGLLEGDIGGASLFASEEPEPEPVVEEEDTSDQEEAGPSIQEEGGELNIYQYNNVGTHILPGDTITFFITIRNTGTGRVYDAVLDLGLIKDGEDIGGGIFELGDIRQGEGVKVTTGLVLSEEAEPGDYIAHALVTGHVGPDNELISAYADSFFKIAGFSSLPLMPGMVEEVQAIEPREEVLGAITAPTGLTLEQKFGLLLVGLLLFYLPAKGYQKREELALAFSRSKGFVGAKSAVLRSLLMSFVAWFLNN